VVARSFAASAVLETQSLAANLSSTAVHLVASPPEEQEDHAQHSKLLQHAGADG
jgi:hypothetical protein